MPRYAELVYNGFWFSPEREALQALVDKTQEFVTGTVRLKLYKVGGDLQPAAGLMQGRPPVLPRQTHLMYMRSA